MSYGPSIMDVTRSYQDDPELRRRIEAMRAQQAQMQGANPQAQVSPAAPQGDKPQGFQPHWSMYPMIAAGAGIKSVVDPVVNMVSGIPEAAKSAWEAFKTPGEVLSGERTLTPEQATEWGVNVASSMGGGPAGTLGAGGRKAAMASMAARSAAEAAPLSDFRVAQRVPTAKGTPLDPARHDLRIGMDAMREDPEMFANAAARSGDVVRKKTMTSADPEEILGEAKAHMMSNLDQIYQRQDPIIRERSAKWYPGGNRLLGELAEQYGVPKHAAAGAVAALSPQKDWFQNFDLARRTMQSLGEDPILTQAMLDKIRATGSEGVAKFADELAPQVGRRLSAMGNKDAAMATVVHDLTGRERAFPILSPEGEVRGMQMNAANKKGVARPSEIAWGSAKQVENAIQALRSGGDMSQISGALGDRHKVRNFYNNLISPDPRWNDYTSDTHNIAASLLRPLAGKDPEVALGLGAGVSSAATGARGLYGVYADAGRELAGKYGVTPFEMQSPTWEGVRSLFPDTWKTQGNKDKAAAIWKAYREGAISQPAAQKKIFELTPYGVNQTPWR